MKVYRVEETATHTIVVFRPDALFDLSTVPQVPADAREVELRARNLVSGKLEGYATARSKKAFSPSTVREWYASAPEMYLARDTEMLKQIPSAAAS